MANAGEARWSDYVAQVSVVANNAPNGSGFDLLARVNGVNDYYELELLKDGAGVRKWVLATDKRASGRSSLQGRTTGLRGSATGFALTSTPPG